MKPDQQNELKKREESFRVIFENAVDGIFVSDAEGIFTDVNQSAHHLLGYEPGELIGKSIVEVLPPQEIERFFAARESLLAGDQKFEEWTLLRRDGSL
ncbi:MAG TPA: PAS domain-containing protein, partial [Pyrinomonadaceae bacterium]